MIIRFALVSIFMASVPAFAGDPQCKPDHPDWCWYPQHGHCMPCAEKKGSTQIHGDQYASVVSTPDDTVAIAPGHWMIDTQYQANEKVKLTNRVVLAPDQFTFPEKGLPLPGMVGDGYKNYQHPHEWLSGAEVGVELQVADGKTLSVRGGPVMSIPTAPFFVMSPSAKGDMMPRQSHHPADSGHATPGGIRVDYFDERNRIAFAYHTSSDPTPRDLAISSHLPDAYTAGYERTVTENESLKLGAVVGWVLAHDHASGTAADAKRDRELITTFYGTTKHGNLDTTTIFSRALDTRDGTSQIAFSTEGAYRKTAGAIGSRFEIVDRTCEELGLPCEGQAKIKFYQIFADKRLGEKGPATFYLNGSATFANMPKEFQPYYTNGNPVTLQGGIRMEFTKAISFGPAK